MIIIDVNLMRQLLGENWRYILAVLAIIIGLICWYARKKKREENDWFSQAQSRQAKRNEYSDPARIGKNRKKQNTTNTSKQVKWYPTGWVFNEKTGKWDPPDYLSKETDREWGWNENARMWVNPDQMDSEKNSQKYEVTRQKWEQLKKEEELRRSLNPPIQLTEEEKETAKQIKLTRPEMTYEEWKAARQKQQSSGDPRG